MTYAFYLNKNKWYGKQHIRQNINYLHFHYLKANTTLILVNISSDIISYVCIDQWFSTRSVPPTPTQEILVNV